MDKNLEALAGMTYPGRVIIIGREQENKTAVIYVITGRSPSSQARMMEREEKGIRVVPSDEENLKKGNRNLLIYPPVLFGKGIAVSNGKQTVDVHEAMKTKKTAVDVLVEAHKKWDYEPDEPNFTPRISGCVLPSGSYAVGIIKKGVSQAAEKFYFDFPLQAGEGKLIATYQGENRDPLPSFSGEPLLVRLQTNGAKETAESVYSALEPKRGENDFRVAVAVAILPWNDITGDNICIINRQKKRG
ncbi:MAG: hypothetical protein JXB26_15120 [Candidatus Aminicenantes bacterium]|nr:hypothetical protein [Candidatus Aminicenantes bacterium]